MAYRVWVKGERGGGHWSVFVWERFTSRSEAETTLKKALDRYGVSIPKEDFEIREDSG